MNFRLLRNWISLILEQGVLGEPDLTNQDERNDDKEKSKDKEPIEVSAGGVPGASTPLGTGPTYPSKIKKDRKKKKRK